MPLLKEWVYAGFIFTMTGALFSHLAKGNGFSEIFPPLLLVVLIAVSWRYRPADRKLVPTLPVTNFDSATAH
jgi:hypothetical protein